MNFAGRRNAIRRGDEMDPKIRAQNEIAYHRIMAERLADDLLIVYVDEANRRTREYPGKRAEERNAGNI